MSMVALPDSLPWKILSKKLSVRFKMNMMKSQIAYATISVRFIAQAVAPDELKVQLPFAWLKRLGLENLMDFGRRV